MTSSSALERLDRRWFEEALRDVTAGTTVATVAVEPVAAPGAAGEVARVLLSYGDDEGRGPSSVIAKLRGTSETQQAMDQALGLFERERRFYSDVAPLIKVAVPACYFAGDGDSTPLLLEDLRSLRMGDQVTGMDVVDAQRVIDVVADLHAAFWERPIPGGTDWTVSLSDPLFAGMLTQLITSGVPALQERYDGRVPAAMLTTLAEWAPRWTEVLARCDEGPRTFVHNDCRLDNIFFRHDGEPVFIDWQLPGSTRGTQDIAYLLSGSMQPNLLRERWQPLLRRYHERLLAAGVTGYSWEQCLVHYRQSLLYTLAPGVAMLGAMAIAGDERGLADALVLRTLTHAAELDAFGTL